ncbi:hypothetical protein MB901379_03190 [Mycobacterium basiliense]|uniref:DUF5343 domain-containing protein n=1 Tax=Mycobacterium basiliense TaxID=2094119 RepID=A0A447GGL1_9MYCO|nr:DUF5343 domain-containing protein [Mycobacterium basiliense]VDM89612.1 hypothetical protein MB901379_03190 [Mycobacterium basiliense]
MATDLPYTLAPNRIPAIFKEIHTSGTPPKFTAEFLKTLGFSSSNDRAMIKILRQLGFIDANSVPTERYNDYKGHNGSRALAAGLRQGWSELFLSNRDIYKLPVSDIIRRVAPITGTNESISARIANTFQKLCSIADWTEEPQAETPRQTEDLGTGDVVQKHDQGDTGETHLSGQLRLHHDIHVHLPPVSDPAVHRAIFHALKSELL